MPTLHNLTTAHVSPEDLVLATRAHQEKRLSPIPIVIAIVRKDGDFLTVRNRGNDYWQFVAGHMEIGESGEEATLREVQEETGLRGVVTKYLGSYAFYREKMMIALVYEVAYESGVVLAGDDVGEAVWLSVGEKPHFRSEGISEYLYEYFIVSSQEKPA